MSSLAKSLNVAKRSATAELAEFASSFDLADIDDFTLAKVRIHLFDTIGACIAGASQQVTIASEKTMAELASEGNIPVPGQKGRYDLLTAAFLAGTAGHGLELDDGYRPAGAHPGVAIVPAILAAGYRYKISGRAFVSAMVVGYEVMGRVAAAMHPLQRKRGFHNTPISGVIGAAAAVSSIKKHQAVTIRNAFGLAASMASGINTHRSGGDAKRMHPGLAAHNGIMASNLAENGFSGLETALEDRYGFFATFAGTDVDAKEWDKIDILSQGGRVNSDYVIGDCYIKPHACCRHLHPMLDGLIDILVKEDLAPENIHSIEVGIYEVGVVHGSIGWDTFTTAQMSIPFAAATAMHYRSVQLEHFTPEARQNNSVIEDCVKVHTYLDKRLDAAYPQKRPTNVEVKTVDGRSFSKQVDEPLGSARNPVPDSARFRQYKGLVAPVLGENRAEELLENLLRIEEIDDLSGIVELTAL